MALRASAQAYTSFLLFNDYTKSFLESQGDSERDDAGTSYTDDNYWNFCPAGAATVAMMYAGASSPVTPNPINMTGSFIEPVYSVKRVTTAWNASDNDYLSPHYLTRGRAYIMYMAERVQPAAPTSSYFNHTYQGATGNYPGMLDFSTYPTAGGRNLYSVRDALNWETSAHSLYGNWVGYFWAIQAASGSRFSQAQLHTDVVNLTVNSGVPVVVALDAQYLTYNSGTGYGNWGNPGKVTGHAISIIGYDDTAGTYSYIDTCGARCSGGPFNGGVHTITQLQMFSAIRGFGWGYIY